MKTLLIGIDQPTIESSNADPPLAHLAWLLQTGCHGIINDANESPTGIVPRIGEQMADAGKRTKSIPLSSLAEGFQQIHPLLKNPECDCVQVLAQDMASLQQFDAELGNLLEALDTATAILLIYRAETQMRFVLAAPDGSLVGEIANVSKLDFAPTLLELGGDPVPPNMPGKSFAARQSKNAEGSGYSPTEEEIIRERLTGLGYL